MNHSKRSLPSNEQEMKTTIIRRAEGFWQVWKNEKLIMEFRTKPIAEIFAEEIENDDNWG